MFASEMETLHTLHNWIELSADGRGYVRVDNAEAFDLGTPYEMHINDTYSEPVYMMSVFHQLHCLYFQQGYGGANLTEEVAHHSAHCFDNIRQAIMCAADTTLEGKTDTPGWGAKHQCTDYDVMLAWANEHTVYKWRKNMPGEAVL
ncbi:Tat pathway signal sequence protein [Rutstroemia sp. NJR-2017a BBW]|nr:Tat pathway signal sequence protein [Rutstroemia sp. NJR-2017a BBW]